jgi:hypothetical protein
LLISALTVLGATIVAAPAEAEGCPNERLRSMQVYALRLPDCRAYEQASPVDKNLLDAVGRSGSIESSPDGARVRYFSQAPFPGTPGASDLPVYLSTRGGEAWSTRGLLPASNVTSPRSVASVTGWSPELSATMVFLEGSPLLTDGTPSGEPYAANSYLEDATNGTYRLLAPGKAAFAGATPDGQRVLFESPGQLLPAAAPGVVNLYEFHGGALSLAGVLPGGEAPAGGSVAGAGGPALPPGIQPGGATSKRYTERAFSSDGSHVVFSDTGTGQIYVRLNGTSTIQASASQSDPPVTEYWRGATPDGRYVFLTSEARLTTDSTATPGHADLYRFDVERRSMLDLTAQAPEGAGVLGTLGISDDGSYVYFAAKAVLAPGAGTEPRTVNLYVWHENGAPTFISPLDELDEDDWRADSAAGERPGNPAAGENSSRLTPAGTTLLFSSQAKLTGFENAQRNELYVYDATRPLTPDGNPVCISCNAGVGPATAGAVLSSDPQLGIVSDEVALLTRNLSSDGTRVFFESEEALLPQDTNAVRDVYEWERQGTNGCAAETAAFSQSRGGCLYLISTGQSTGESFFGDASADGGDVFFFTRQPLAGQDQDDNLDVYDARVAGGIPAQNPSPPLSCDGEACRAAAVTPPVFGAPASASFTGPGNLTSQPAPTAAVGHKPSRRSKRRHRHRRARHARHGRRHASQRRAA